MSNILIIKHGSLGDIVQISGVLKDLRAYHNDKKLFILTTISYADLLSRCPYIDGVLIDKRLSRLNMYYLYKLKKMLNKFNFTHVYDLQNSSRTSFYKKFILKKPKWNSSKTTLRKGTKKSDYDKDSVLERFKFQLESVNIITKFTLRPDFSWAPVGADHIMNKYFNKKFILIFPFSSIKLSHKQWPYYNELIDIIKSKHNDIEIVVVPGPQEIEEAKKINATLITYKNKPLNIMELAGIINKSNFVIANDTGPAHMAAHLGISGVVLFGHHTTPEKVSIETDKFKAIKVDNLKNLSATDVYSKIADKLQLIN